MSLLDSRQLADLQAAASAAFDLTGIQVMRLTQTKGANGILSESSAVIATVAGAWARPSVEVMRLYASALGAQATWVVRLPIGTNIHNNDLLHMPSGDTLRVQADLTEHSYATCVQVLATEVR